MHPHSHSNPTHRTLFHSPFPAKERKEHKSPLDRLSLPSHYKHSSNETKSEIETTKKRATTTRPSRSAPSTLLNIRFNISLTPLAYLYHRRTKKSQLRKLPPWYSFLFQVIPSFPFQPRSPPSRPLCRIFLSRNTFPQNSPCPEFDKDTWFCCFCVEDKNNPLSFPVPEAPDEEGWRALSESSNNKIRRCQHLIKILLPLFPTLTPRIRA